MSVGPIDVSVVVTFHGEGALASRTLRSLCEAATWASAYGLSSEVVIVADDASVETWNAIASAPHFAFIARSVLTTVLGSLGAARNLGIAAAKGEFVCVCDGDDLISANTLCRHYADITERGDAALYFPEWVINFGSERYALRNFELGPATPFALFGGNPFVSRAFGRRRLFLENPYPALTLTDRFAFEDWSLHCDLVARGYELRVTPGIVLFYRRGDVGMLAQTQRLTSGVPVHGPMFSKTGPLASPASADELWRSLGVPASVMGPLADESDVIIAARLASAIEEAISPSTLVACDCWTNAGSANIESALAFRDVISRCSERRFDGVSILDGLPPAQRPSDLLLYIGHSSLGEDVVNLRDYAPNSDDSTLAHLCFRLSLALAGGKPVEIGDDPISCEIEKRFTGLLDLIHSSPVARRHPPSAELKTRGESPAPQFH